MQAFDGQLALDGGTLSYQKAGHGTPLTFVHGHTLDMQMWQPQFVSFEPDFEVLRYDMRGYGASSLPKSEDYLHREDLKQLHDQLGRVSTHLVGLSLGGQVALEYAVHYPECVERLVLIDPFLADFTFSEGWTQTIAQMIESGLAGDLGSARDIWLNSGLFTPALVNPASATALKESFERYSGWHFANPFHLPVAPISDRLKEITAPTLVLVGERDIEDFVNISGFLAENIPNARLEVIQGAGHMANLEAPAEVNRILKDFLAA